VQLFKVIELVELVELVMQQVLVHHIQTNSKDQFIMVLEEVVVLIIIKEVA
jgi:hypothetical protein